MFRVILAVAALIFVVTVAKADVGIGTQVITTGTEIKVLEPGPDLQTIIDGISDEGQSNPYLIKLGPGEFAISQSLTMSPYVSIVGSGQGVTILKGAISSDSVHTSAIVKGSDSAALTDLSVENTGGSNHSVAIYNHTANPRIERVIANASGGSSGNYGVYNAYAYTLTMRHVVATAVGGGEGNSYGVYNVDSFRVRMIDVDAMGICGPNSHGVYNAGWAAVEMTAGTARAGCGTSGTNSYGVYNADGSWDSRIKNSRLEGGTDAMRFTSSDLTRISDTQLVGGVNTDPPGTRCRNTYDENLLGVIC